MNHQNKFKIIMPDKVDPTEYFFHDSEGSKRIARLLLTRLCIKFEGEGFYFNDEVCVSQSDFNKTFGDLMHEIYPDIRWLSNFPHSAVLVRDAVKLALFHFGLMEIYKNEDDENEIIPNLFSTYAKMLICMCTFHIFENTNEILLFPESNLIKSDKAEKLINWYIYEYESISPLDIKYLNPNLVSDLFMTEFKEYIEGTGLLYIDL